MRKAASPARLPSNRPSVTPTRLQEAPQRLCLIIHCFWEEWEVEHPCQWTRPSSLVGRGIAGSDPCARIKTRPSLPPQRHATSASAVAAAAAAAPRCLDARVGVPLGKPKWTIGFRRQTAAIKWSHYFGLSLNYHQISFGPHRVLGKSCSWAGRCLWQHLVPVKGGEQCRGICPLHPAVLV